MAEDTRIRPGVDHGSPRIAVIIPCFNDGAFIEETVASVREAEPVEIVVVDDGSTDERTPVALAAIEARGDAKVVRHQVNTGISAARMTGLAQTSARYVYPLDGDDALEPRSLAVLADRLDNDAAVDFAYGNGTYLGDDEVWTSRPWDPFTLLYLNAWPPCLIRRDVLLAVGGWSHTDCYEDWDLLFALAEHDYEGAHVDQIVLHYRRHVGGREHRRCLQQFGRAYRVLRARHQPLFARRAELAGRSPVPWRTRLLMPLRHGSRPLLPYWLYWWLRGRRTQRPRS